MRSDVELSGSAMLARNQLLRVDSWVSTPSRLSSGGYAILQPTLLQRIYHAADCKHMHRSRVSEERPPWVVMT
jgi:hypothetical protein